MTEDPQPPFFYVYMLQSIPHPDAFYVGYTTELTERLAHHNRGIVSHTADLRPWKIKTAVAFSEEPAARKFELFPELLSREDAKGFEGGSAIVVDCAYKLHVELGCAPNFKEGVKRIVNNHQNFASSRLRVNQSSQPEPGKWVRP